MLGFPSARLAASEKLPEGQGFAVERADPESAGQLWLALTRRSAGSAELFAAMACDVVGALDDSAAAGAGEAKLLRVFIGRVGAWQEFMRKGSTVLSPEAEIGLVGELTVLRMIIDVGMPPVVAVESWGGPLDGVGDRAHRGHRAHLDGRPTVALVVAVAALVLASRSAPARVVAAEACHRR